MFLIERIALVEFDGAAANEPFPAAYSVAFPEKAITRAIVSHPVHSLTSCMPAVIPSYPPPRLHHIIITITSSSCVAVAGCDSAALHAPDNGSGSV